MIPELDEGALAESEPFWERPQWWKSTGKAAIALFAGTGAGFASTVIAARALGPVNYGTVVLAIATVVAIATLLDFSLEEATIHFGAAAIERDDAGAVLGLIRTSLRFDLAVGVAVSGAIALGAVALADVTGGGQPAVVLIRLAALESLVATTNGTTGAVLLLSGRPELRAVTLSATGFLRLGAVAIAAVGGATPTGVLWAYVISSAVGAAGQALLARHRARRLWGGVSGPRVAPVSTRTLAAFGAHSSVTTTLIAVRDGLVSIVLGRQVGARAVGVFNVASLPVTLSAVATAPLRLTSYPEQARLAARGDRDTLWRGIRLYTVIGLGVGALGIVVGWFALPWLIPILFSDRFDAAVGPARILLIAGAVGLTVAWAKALPAALGRPSVRTWVVGAELVVTAVLVVVLAHRGATGAAIAVTVGTVAAALLWLVVAHRLLAEMPVPDRDPDQTAGGSEPG